MGLSKSESSATVTYRTMSDYLSSVAGGRVRKIAVNAGLSCPNRDGSLSRAGCSYCNNASFNPSYAFCRSGQITKQIEEGIRFSQNKGEVTGYLPYFQSFSNTYGDTDRLIGLYEEALAYPGVRGLVIATRPDCLKDDLMEYFCRRFGKDAPQLHPFLLVELGIESTNDDTLRRINRGHTFACAADAVKRLSDIGIAVGVHIIIGLPGENESDYMSHARKISELPVSTLKLHQLQIIKGTPLADEFTRHPEAFHLMSAGEYAGIVIRFLALLRPDIAIDRFVSESPADMVLAPKWGIRPSEFQKMVGTELSARIKCNFAENNND